MSIKQIECSKIVVQAKTPPNPRETGGGGAGRGWQGKIENFSTKLLKEKFNSDLQKKLKPFFIPDFIRKVVKNY